MRVRLKPRKRVKTKDGGSSKPIGGKVFCLFTLLEPLQINLRYSEEEENVNKTFQAINFYQTSSILTCKVHEPKSHCEDKNKVLEEFNL